MSTARGSRSRSLVFWVAVMAGGCAGDGTGLDEFGNPLTQSDSELKATLGSIQSQVFSAICTRCHTGASAPLGLALDPGVAWSNLVDVPSVEIPELKRVHPSRPDSSYLVWKIEDLAGIVGERMPLGYPPLSQEQIDAVRTWIERGAARD